MWKAVGEIKDELASRGVRFVLASKSPRRSAVGFYSCALLNVRDSLFFNNVLQLLSDVGVGPFAIVPSAFEENLDKNTTGPKVRPLVCEFT